MITLGEFLGIHSTLLEIVEWELGIDAPVPEAVQEIVKRFAEGGAAREASEQPIPPVALAWIALLDMAVDTHLLRRHMKRLVTGEDVIRALLRYYVGLPKHSETCRDKVDWLATYYFQVREERTKEPTGWPKIEVHEILQGVSYPPLSGDAETILADFAAIVDEIRYFEKFVQITDSRIIQRGRALKNRFGQDFYHPEVLAAVINYNLIFGKKFHLLLLQTVQDVREFASEIESGASDTHDLVQTDYRSTTDAFHHLGELDRKRVTKDPHAPAAAPDSVSRRQRLKDLGINADKETIALKQRREELAVRLRANPALVTLQGASRPVMLLEWEAAAFRTSYPDSEKSFRAESAYVMTQSIAILSLADDELNSYNQKKGTEFFWKKHYDTLLFLFQEGREHIDRMNNLAMATEKKGLSEKARQLRESAEKLQKGLAEVAAVFKR